MQIHLTPYQVTWLKEKLEYFAEIQEDCAASAHKMNLDVEDIVYLESDANMAREIIKYIEQEEVR